MASESESPAPPKEEKSEKSEKKEISDEEKSRKETKPGTVSGGTSPALQTPSDQTKYGSGGGRDTQKAPATQSKGDKPKRFASPFARKLALERGIPLAEIKGTGPEGRIVKVSRDICVHLHRVVTDLKLTVLQDDVEKYKPGASSTSTSPTSGATTTPGQHAPAAPAAYEDIPLSNMRRTIGKRLLESKQQLPHYYLTVEINMGKLSVHSISEADALCRPNHEIERNVQQGW